LAIPLLLRASHIKPWASCDSDEERLDVFNGLLLAPHLDALFDGGWMTFDSKGLGIFPSRLTAMELELLGVQPTPKLSGFSKQHQAYLEFHRDAIFKK
jgi:predicted restriction endonuclease